MQIYVENDRFDKFLFLETDGFRESLENTKGSPIKDCQLSGSDLLGLSDNAFAVLDANIR